MAWVFVRLKVALLRSGFAASRGYLALYIVGSLLAFALGVLAAIGIAGFLGDGSGQTGEVLLLVALPLVWIAWIVSPLLGGGQGEQTVDPSRLELLPLSFGQQVRGLLITGLLGPAALGTFVGALGPVFAAGESWVVRVFLVVVAVIFVVLCVAWSRSVGAAFAGILDSRRGKELLVILTALIIAPMYFISEVLTSATETLAKETSAGWWNLLVVLPPGALGRAISASRDDEWLLAIGLAAWGVVGVALALLIWRWSLARRLSGGGGQRVGKARSGSVGESVLYPAYLKWLPRSVMGAVTAKEMRYYFSRSAISLQQLVLGAFFGVVIVGGQLFSDSSSPSEGLSTVTFLGSGVVFMVLFMSSTNVFGVDNAAVSTYLLTGVDMVRVLLGKFVALMLIAVPLGLVFQIGVVIYRKDYDSLWLSLLAVGVPWLIWLGLGSVLSVFLAAPVLSGKQRTGGLTALGVIGGLFGALAISVVVVLLAVLAGAAVGSEWVALAVAWLLGGVVAVIGLSIARRRLVAEPTKLLERLGGDRL